MPEKKLQSYTIIVYENFTDGTAVQRRYDDVTTYVLAAHQVFDGGKKATFSTDARGDDSEKNYLCDILKHNIFTQPWQQFMLRAALERQQHKLEIPEGMTPEMIAQMAKRIQHP